MTDSNKSDWDGRKIPKTAMAQIRALRKMARISEVWPERLQKSRVKEIIGGERERKVEEEEGCGYKLIL